MTIVLHVACIFPDSKSAAHSGSNEQNAGISTVLVGKPVIKPGAESEPQARRSKHGIRVNPSTRVVREGVSVGSTMSRNAETSTLTNDIQTNRRRPGGDHGQRGKPDLPRTLMVLLLRGAPTPYFSEALWSKLNKQVGRRKSTL